MTDSVVLVDGSDPTLVAEASARVIDELLGGTDRSLALEDHAGDELDLAAIADGCATPPFLVERRVVVIRDIGRYTQEEVAPLLRYLEDPLPSTSLVLVSGGGRTSQKLVAAAKAAGRVVSLAVERNQAAGWVRDRVAESGVSLTAGAERLVVDHLGEDVSRLVALLRVLEAAYGPGAEVGEDDLGPYLGDAGSVTPWAFTDAIDDGDASTALTLLRRLSEGGDRHPLVVLAIVHRHVQNLLRLDGPGITGEQDAARALGIAAGRSTFPAKKALRAARQWGSASIGEAIVLVAEAEADLKGASAWPGPAVLEVLVARLCRLARPRRAGAGRRPE